MITVATYSARYECRNCGWSGMIRFDKGKEAYDKQSCPNCDCFTAEKALSTKPVVPVPLVPRREPIDPPPYIPWPTPFPRKDPWWEDPRPYRRSLPYCDGNAVVGRED